MKAVLTGTLLAWPLVAPPGLGDAKVAQLRSAFQAMMKDPEMLKDAEKGNLEIDPVAGEEMQDIVKGLYVLPPELVAKAKSILQ
jgi:tripartite-type tricarboxylate transporter receptor subunit TctC